MQYSTVIFDLDGTLLDTVEDIGHAANQVLLDMGYPPHPLSAFRQFVGSGVAVLFERAVPQDVVHQNVINQCMLRFSKVYEVCWNQSTLPYPGIPVLLERLLELDCRIAVLSNKPDRFTKKCVKEYFSDYHIGPIFGQRSGVARKPDPQSVWEIIKYHGVSVEQTIFVGDSEIDMQTAQNAGIFSVGVTWGYGRPASLVAQGANLLIDHPEDLLSFITSHS